MKLLSTINAHSAQATVMPTATVLKAPSLVPRCGQLVFGGAVAPGQTAPFCFGGTQNKNCTVGAKTAGVAQKTAQCDATRVSLIAIKRQKAMRCSIIPFLHHLSHTHSHCHSVSFSLPLNSGNKSTEREYKKQPAQQWKEARKTTTLRGDKKG